MPDIIGNIRKISLLYYILVERSDKKKKKIKMQWQILKSRAERIKNMEDGLEEYYY